MRVSENNKRGGFRVKSVLKRLLLAALLLVNLSTMLFDWQIIEGLTSRGGLLVLSGNAVLSCMILSIYFLSLLLYGKLKTICFISGLCSLCMLFALEFSKFEFYGRFNNSAIGVYLGLLTIIITIAAYILLLRKETFSGNK